MALPKAFFTYLFILVILGSAITHSAYAEIRYLYPREASVVFDRNVSGAGSLTTFRYSVKIDPKNISIECKAYFAKYTASGPGPTYDLVNTAVPQNTKAATFTYRLENGFKYSWYVVCTPLDSSITLINYYIHPGKSRRSNYNFSHFHATSLFTNPKNWIIIKKPLVEISYRSSIANASFPTSCTLFFEGKTYQINTSGSYRRKFLLEDGDYFWYLKCRNGEFNETTPEYYFIVETNYTVTIPALHNSSGAALPSPVDLSYVYNSYPGTMKKPQRIFGCKLYVDGSVRDSMASMKFNETRQFNLTLSQGEHKAFVACRQAYSGEYVFAVE
ncbi:hypothetical protein FJZ26_03060 [Candidatus Parvarchaeota archaeon]|nr:hypothetical protein [Candidatus Parvarchaeota archaeon]